MKYPSSVLYIGFPSTSITCVTIFSVNAVAPLTASLLHEGAFLILMLPLNTLLTFPLILTAGTPSMFSVTASSAALISSGVAVQT